jgi:hypothetical protein
MSVRERNTVIYRSVYEQPQASVHETLIENEKWEDNSIPFFSRDLPVSSKEKNNENAISVFYTWGEESGPSEFDVLKIKSITFRKDTDLRALHKINSRDGVDSFSLDYDGTTYLLRKTTEEIAKALFNASFKIKGAIESIVGYIATVLGNFYVLSAIEKGSWSFDEKLGSGHVNLVKAESLDEKQKTRLIELSLDSLMQLHRQKLVLGKFSMDNLLLTAKGLVFTDLRKMRLSKKSTFFIDEFISAMRFLFSKGLATKADVTHATMIYAIDLEKECGMWFREQSGKNPDDEFELVSALENRIFA